MCQQVTLEIKCKQMVYMCCNRLFSLIMTLKKLTEAVSKIVEGGLKIRHLAISHDIKTCPQILPCNWVSKLDYQAVQHTLA